MNKFWKAVLINVAGVYGVSLVTLLWGDASGLLFFPILLSILEFFLGILFLLFVPGRTGQVMLAASGIIFLIGLGVCSVFPPNFH